MGRISQISTTVQAILRFIVSQCLPEAADHSRPQRPYGCETKFTSRTKHYVTIISKNYVAKLLCLFDYYKSSFPRCRHSVAIAPQSLPLPTHIVQPRKRQHHVLFPALYSYWFFRLYCSVIAMSSLNLSSRSDFSKPWFICFRLCLSHVKSFLSSRLYLDRFLWFFFMNARTSL